MIYFSADDYGLCESTSSHIRQCIEAGALNKVSVFPNFDKVDLTAISKSEKTRLSLHLNLVEGKCLSPAKELPHLADENGNFIHTFTSLFRLWLTDGKKLEKELYKEIRAQVLYWISILPENTPFCIDAHQHTHMIPAVFSAMLKVLKDEGITPEYIRIPAEPLSPYLKAPSLYFTYSPVNIIKQWLLKSLWLINKGKAKKADIKTSLFAGILFSGKMDKERVSKVLSSYIKLAGKCKTDIEVLFHPGYLDGTMPDFKAKNIVFKDFYLSENRKTEFDSVMTIPERSVK